MSVRLKSPPKASRTDIPSWLQMVRRATRTRIELWQYDPTPRKLGAWPGNLATLADELSAALAASGETVSGYGLLAYAEKGPKADKAFSVAWARAGMLTLIPEKTTNLQEMMFLHLVRTLETTEKAMARVELWKADLELLRPKDDDPLPTSGGHGA